MADHTPKKYPSLRFFITVTIMIIVGFVLLLSVGFYYIKTSSILRKTSRDSIVRELNQVNDTIQDQVETIDSVIPLFMSNEVIQNALENPDAGTNHPFSVERQMSYIYNSSALSEKNFTDSIYIYNNHNIIYHAYTSGILENVEDTSDFLQSTIDASDPHLMCYTSPLHEQNMYFARNLYSSNSGNRIGMIVININARKWIEYCSKTIDSSWFIMLFNREFSLSTDSDFSGEDLQTLYSSLNTKKGSVLFKEQSFAGKDYFMASQSLERLGLTSAVAAPKELLLENLNSTLKSYLLVTLAVALIALFAAFIISRAVTRPIDTMILLINEISKGNRSSLPPESFLSGIPCMGTVL